MSDTANPLEKIQREVMEETGPEEEVVNSVEEVVNQMLGSLEAAETAADVVKILLRLSVLGVSLGILLGDLEARFQFIASQCSEPSFKELVTRSGMNIGFARRTGRSPGLNDLDKNGRPTDQVQAVRAAIENAGETLKVAPSTIQALCEAAEDAINT